MENELINFGSINLDMFLNSFLMMNKFKLSRITVEKIKELVVKVLEKEKRIKRRLKFYLVFDSIILNLYDRMED